MKSKIIKKPEEDYKFPLLMISPSGVIVLMTGREGNTLGEGIQLTPEDVGICDPESFVGYTADDWILDNFEPFTGTVELSND